MLECIAIGLVVIWLAAIVAGLTFGGSVHLLLVAAFVMIIVRSFKSDGNNWPVS